MLRVIGLRIFDFKTILKDWEVIVGKCGGKCKRGFYLHLTKES